jgi:hypothetical protein
MPSEIAWKHARSIVGDISDQEAAEAIDAAIKEACKPLVKAVDKARIIYLIDGEICVESESYLKIVNAAQKLKGEPHAK